MTGVIVEKNVGVTMRDGTVAASRRLPPGHGRPLPSAPPADAIQHRDAARGAAERLYAAVEADDGAAACRELSPDTRDELESQEQSSCEDAVLELDLRTGDARAQRVEVFTNEAAVHLTGGDTVFLDETREGWRVSALGCRDQRMDSPADCEVQA